MNGDLNAHANPDAVAMGDAAPADEHDASTVASGNRGYLIGMGLATLLTGVLWIMSNINHNMLPMDQIMKMQR